MLILISLPILFVIELIYFKIADRYDIIDRPNERSSHKTVTLRGGGIIFYFAALYYFLAFHFPYPWFMLGLTIITVVSFIDDITSLSSKTRMLLHFVAMILLFMQCGLLGGEFPWWYIIIAIIVCTGVINAYNFMDGINGMTGAYSLSILCALVYINNYQYLFIKPELIYIIIIGVLIFNFFNFRKKAKCFAGDVGSISIAFIILFMVGRLIIITGNISYIILLLLYGVDTILTLIHRIILHEDIFHAHRKHAYQIMANELKIPHLVVSLYYLIVQTLFLVGYFFMFKYCYLYFIISIILVSISYILFIKKYFRLHILSEIASK
ncbi:MAG: glycosyltransferase family 4 protein [Bacteroidales bacterium]